MNVAVIGLGLIGGSLLKALAGRNGHEVTGYDADPATRTLAGDDGYKVAGSVAEAIAGAELVVLAVPLPVLPGVIAELAGYDGLVTDVTSVKGPVRELAHGIRRFVGGHPMAGKETSGFAAADPALFEGCAWVLCLEPGETGLDDWLTAAALFTAIGARVVPATAAEHDRAVAAISHVPHLAAAAIARRLVGNPLAATLGAGSFRDGTRVAATRAELIAAMCGGNAPAVREVLSAVIDDLQQRLAELDDADPVAALIPALREAGDARRAWPPRPGAAAEEPAGVAELLALGRAGGWVTAVAENHVTISTMRPESDRIGS
ncbi:prephenate dehydrogenase [Paractinoplanes durhamensis]|uniref:Prephenate dehydrogenase n=1 Tax=Paractinoplanes durhamensis TaxID=113563 RepID=A0ABQ3Z7X0_9ACTN|nr:prephenate dehydrogenase/arogenate dehydrogenase family protein [Actinoplanes durhamensis]GIE05927.1 prephenate dehydrogenase [Actinoplanes durhamensis]